MITTLDNFQQMNPATPGYSKQYQHYYIGGANPTYYLDTSGVQEQQVAPLAASVAWTKGSQTTAFTGTICQMVSGVNTAFDAFSVGNDSQIYGINATTLITTSFGNQGGISSGDHRLGIFAGYIIASIAGSGSQAEIGYVPLTGGSLTSIATLPGTRHELEPFGLYMIVSNIDSVLGAIVQKIEYTITPNLFTIINGFALGEGWNILKMRNYNDQYVAIAATQGNFNSTYIYLWDGSSNFPVSKIAVPGKFLDMRVINGTLQVAVWENGGSVSNIRTSLYYLNKTTLTLEFSPIFSSMIVPANNQDVLCNFSNKVGIILASTDFLTYGSRNNGLEEFCISTGIAFDHFSSTVSGYLIGSAYNSGTGNTDLYGYISSNTIYNTIKYISDWIPVYKLASLDIVYDTPPQSGTDSINTTIYGKGENISEAGQNQPIVLNPINTSTILSDVTGISQWRTRIDSQGFTGSFVKILITTVNTTWRPIIRSIGLVQPDILTNKKKK